MLDNASVLFQGLPCAILRLVVVFELSVYGGKPDYWPDAFRSWRFAIGRCVHVFFVCRSC